MYELGAGVYLKETDAAAVRNAVAAVLEEPVYREKAGEIAESFYRCGGAGAAAEKIERAAKG